jgi:hypothetical protein
MLTTKQVRDIMRRHINPNIWNPMWTNKTSKNCGNVRAVKAYFNGDVTHPMIKELLQAGVDLDDLNFTAGSEHNGLEGLTVRCRLAQ